MRKGNKPCRKQLQMDAWMAFNTNVVVIKLSTNDTKPMNWIYKDEYLTDYLSLIDTQQALPAHPKIYLCLPVSAYAKDGESEIVKFVWM